VSRLAAAGGAISAAAAALLWLAPRASAPAQPVSPAPAPPVAMAYARPARLPVAATPAPPEVPHDVVLHGVLLRGARSQAVLSVGGAAQQPYALGDAVERGWTLHEVGAAQVVLANGRAQAVVPVAAMTSAASHDAAPAAVAAIEAGTGARRPALLAGQAMPFTAGASERNRRFLEAVRARRRGGS
jgi:hypothetical protein